MQDPSTERPLFATRCIELCCADCKEAGKTSECNHLLHLVPSWQSEERHRKLKIMMQDRPDLIQSELAGLAFDSLQQVFRKVDIEFAFGTPPLAIELDTTVWIVVDPAAGGPSSDFAVLSMCRQRGSVTVLGIDVLGGCKEVEKQFGLVERHILRLRENRMLQGSEMVIMCERNLGFESEHMQRALSGIANVRHRIDHAAQRYGIIMNEEVKYGACTLVNNMLREQRISVADPVCSEDPEGNRRRLKEQMSIYSMQFKAAQNAFGRQKVALSGKVGGMKDDVVICLQLGCYYSKTPALYAA